MNSRILISHSKTIGLMAGCWLLATGSAFADLKLVAQKSDRSESPWKGVKTPLARKGNYALPTGFMFDATLITGIFSYNLATPAVAVTEEDVPFLGDIVLPRGTRFIGVVSVEHSFDRANIEFMTCVFPNGEEIPMRGIALAPDGSAGIAGKLVTHHDSTAAKIAMKSILTGVGTVSASAAVPTMGSTVASNLSNNTADSIDVSSPKDLDSIEVDPKAAIKIFLNSRTEY